MVTTEGEIEDSVPAQGNIAIPVDIGGQGGDATCTEAQCQDVRVVQYPFERRMSETDGDYVVRLRQRYNELCALTGLRPGTFLNDLDPAYAAELAALYYALLHEIGVPEDGFTIPARSDEEYEAFCLVFGVRATDWLISEPASDAIQRLYEEDPNQWIASNISDGNSHIWAAGTFPGPDGIIYYRLTNANTITSINLLGLLTGESVITTGPVPIDPVLGGFASGGYALWSSTFDENGAGWLRDFFWELYTTVGGDIQQFGPVPSQWFDQSAAVPVRTLDIFYSDPPAATSFEPYQIADNSLNALRVRPGVNRGTVGVNRTHRGVVFRAMRSMRSMRSQMNNGNFTRTERNAALQAHGPAYGVNSPADFRRLASSDPNRARELANTVARSAILSNPATQQSMRASRNAGSRAIEAQGAQVNVEGIDVPRGTRGGYVRIIPDGLRNVVRNRFGRIERAGEVHEAKDVATLSLTRQIQAEIDFATSSRGTFVLYVRPNTHLSSNLKSELRSVNARVLDFNGNRINIRE